MMKSSRYEQFKKLLQRAQKVLAGRVSFEFRKYNHPHALLYSHARGSRIYAINSNEHLDFTLSQGLMLHTGFTNLDKVKGYQDTFSWDCVKCRVFISGMQEQGVRVVGRGLWYISTAIMKLILIRPFKQLAKYFKK